MSRRITHWLEGQAAIQLHAGPKRTPEYKLSPGQYSDLCAEMKQEAVTEIRTCQGVHKVSRIDCHTRATGDNVILCPREDLFQETDRGSGIEMMSFENDVTSVPDNIGCVEVVSCGDMVSHVKPGDIAFVDFYDVKQGYCIANETLFVCGGDAFKAMFDIEKQIIIPLANYVTTRANNDRFKVALTGTDRLHVLDMTFTDGIVSGRSSKGTPAAHTLYQEVVAVGPLTKKPRPGLATKTETALLDEIAKWPGGDSNVSRFDALHELAPLVEALLIERKQGRKSDIARGDLVSFCKESATRIRVRGEYQYLVHYDRVLAVIDDDAILADAIARGTAGRLVTGGGFSLV